MMMPEKIYVEDNNNDGDSGVWGCCYESYKDTPYIRADIAEDLARALDGVMHYISGYAGSNEQDAVDTALARYHALTN